MNTKDLADVIGAIAEARRIERERCLAAVAAEPEPDGDIPEEMWTAITSNRDTMTKALLIAVRMTKDGIRRRILGELAKEE